MVYVYQGTVEQGPMFFDRLVSEVEAIADPDGELFGLFGVKRGGVQAMFGLRSWRRGLQAVAKGHFINRKIGDGWTLPTIVAVRDGVIVWEHRGEHAGDHPNVALIPKLLAG